MFQLNFQKNSFLIIFLFISFYTDAQNGIFFQAIARDFNTNPARDRIVFVQTNIIQTTPSGTILLMEEHETKTDAYGVFSIMVGNGKRVGGIVSNLSSIDWSKGPFYLNLKIAITPIASSNTWDYSKEWIDLGTTIFGTVPFALYSANTANIDKKLNSLDTIKMLEPYAKTLSVQILSSTIDTKLSINDTAIMLNPYSRTKYTDSALLTKLTVSDTIKYSKKTYIDSVLLTKLNVNGSASSLTSFPILNQNTTGNASTATSSLLAGNISATANSTLTSLTNLHTIGTITNGTWSATTIDIMHGGTGLTKVGLSGEVLTTTTTGTLTWTSPTKLSGVHYLGESYGGGIVFHVYDNGKHGLIISPEDQSTGVNASPYTNSTSITVTNAIRDGVNAGMFNTERIILSQGSSNYAAQIAANYKGGGYGDWYLPSIAEMQLISLNYNYISSTFNTSNMYKVYWSSNENPSDKNQIWCSTLNIVSGNYVMKYGNPSIRVRAIRAF